MNPKKIEILERNFRLYWAGKEPEISDARFDQLLQELKHDNPQHALLFKLGLNVEKGVEYKHHKPMLSLDKVYQFSDLQRWIRKVSRTSQEHFIVQYKFDGLAGKLEGGVLSTRGDGYIGENISRHKQRIKLIRRGCISNLLTVPEDQTILGEIVISKEKFEQYKKIGKQEFSHPRNFVAGMINRKDSFPSTISLHFVEYSSSPFLLFLAKELLCENGLQVWQQICSYFEEKQIYPTDGLVIKLQDEEYAESLGFTEHHPLGVIAYKFYGNASWTTLQDILWSHGKNCLTPVAIIRPVKLSGVTISKVTLHNAKFILDKKIHIGDELKVERAGEVIPHVLDVKQKSDSSISLPVVCPTCGSSLSYQEPELRCSNKNCPGTKLQLLISSLQLFEIDGLGITIIEHLYDMGVIKTPADIFVLTIEQLLKIPKFGQKSANKLLSNIQKAKAMTPEVVLASLNTPGVGKSMYAKILSEIPFEQLIRGVDFNVLANLPNIGPTRAAAIKKSIGRNKEYLHQLLQYVNIKKEQHKTGLKICFTGKMPQARSYYENKAKEHGFVPVDAVTKDLNILVISDAGWTSNKTQKAQSLGITILTLEQWQNEL